MPTPFDWQEMDRSRLRLALGSAADPVEPVPTIPGRLKLSARVPGEDESFGPSRAITIFAPPPKGPTPGALLDRRATLIALSHPGLVAPLATGTFDGAAWVVDPLPPAGNLAAATADGRTLPISQVVSVMQSLARALAALHRRGLSHGAIGADLVAIGPAADEARLFGLGENVSGSPSGDMHDLGELAWLALAGSAYAGANGPSLTTLRPEVPEQLASLVEELLRPAHGRRPLKAEAVLQHLDPLAAPAAEQFALVDGSGRQARQPRLPARWMVLALLLAVAVILGLVWR